jgi:hypothetical protein
VGRTLLSAAFDFGFELLSGRSLMFLEYCKEKSTSKAADRACPELVEGRVRPTQSIRYLGVTLVI